MRALAERIPDLPSGEGVFLRAFAAGLVPEKLMSIGEWAGKYRWVSAESGSPFPGKWDGGRTPYMAEIEEVASLDHPSTDVVIKKSAQLGASELGINLFGSIAAKNARIEPCPILIVLPTIEQAARYNRLKLQPAIDATEVLRHAVFDVISRDEKASSSFFKRFLGGSAVLTGANSSAGLQMISARVIIFDEVSEFPQDAGGRGDPVDQALARGKAWTESRPKRIYISTPGLAGTCRITALFEASDQRRYYLPCPQCGSYHDLAWEDLRWKSETWPHEAFFVAPCCGYPTQRRELAQMNAAGKWLKRYPGTNDNPAPPSIVSAKDIADWRARSAAGRQPGFELWQAYSPFVPWDETVREWKKAEGDPTKLKVFFQQTRGLAWEEMGEAPPAEKLMEVRGGWTSRRWPDGALFLTGGGDLQGDRLEWAVYAWGRSLRECWLIDHDVIAGDPAQAAIWDALALVVDRTYEDRWGRPHDIDAFGIDAGYLSQQVYRFARSRLPTDRATRKVYALDGRAGWRLPALGTPKSVDIDFNGRKLGSTLLWPVGTFDLKSEVYACLRQAIAGRDATGGWPGIVAHFNQSVDRPYFDQLTAEYIEDRVRGGKQVKEWVVRKSQRNEALDIAVYARALAHHLADSLTEADWRDLALRRGAPPESEQPDLAHLWAPPLATTSATAAVPMPAADPSALTPVAAPVAAGGGRRLITSPYLNS